jgi:predicted RNase H-like HicB family nuclease
MTDTRGTARFTVHFEEVEEGGFVAWVPDLPGCVTDGETLEQTKEHVKEAILLYLETLAEDGEPIPKAKRCFPARFGV